PFLHKLVNARFLGWPFTRERRRDQTGELSLFTFAQRRHGIPPEIRNEFWEAGTIAIVASNIAKPFHGLRRMLDVPCDRITGASWISRAAFFFHTGFGKPAEVGLAIFQGPAGLQVAQCKHIGQLFFLSLGLGQQSQSLFHNIWRLEINQNLAELTIELNALG